MMPRPEEVAARLEGLGALYPRGRELRRSAGRRGAAGADGVVVIHVSQGVPPAGSCSLVDSARLSLVAGAAR